MVELVTDRVHLVEVGVENSIEAAPIGPAGEPVESPPEPTDLSSLDDGHDQRCEDKNREADHDHAENGLDEGVQVDRSILRAGLVGKQRVSAGGPSLAGGPHRKIHWPPAADAILRPTHGSRSEFQPLMAKRSRVAARPGQRRPLQRSVTRPDAGAAPRPEGSVTREEEARAAELEAAILAEQEAAEATRRSPVRGRATPETAIRVGPSSTPLATRAAEEYGYVRRDIRRITIVGGSLLAVLAVLHVLVNVAHLFTI